MTTAFIDIETTGLNAYTDRITCIGIILDGEEEIALTDFYEKKLLEHFLDFLEEKRVNSLIAYNGNKFDFPFIKTRLLKYGLKQYLQVFEDIATVDLKDEFEEYSFPSASRAYPIYRKPNLEEAAQFFDIPLKKTGDGKQAVIMWHENKIDTLKEYCLNDVKMLKAIFEKI